MLMASAGQGLLNEFRAKLFFHLQRLSLRYHDTQGTAESVYRVQMDAPAIRDIAINSVIPTLGSSLTLVAMVVIIVSIDWQLAVVALAVSPVLFVLARSYTTRMRPRYREARRLEGFSIEIVQQALAAYNKEIPKAEGTALRTVEAAEGYAVKRVNEAKGAVSRFEQVFEEYKKAPEITRQRIYLETMQDIYQAVDRKIIIDESATGVLPLLNLGGER